jgi:hypothetical protein
MFNSGVSLGAEIFGGEAEHGQAGSTKEAKQECAIPGEWVIHISLSVSSGGDLCEFLSFNSCLACLIKLWFPFITRFMTCESNLVGLMYRM